jgi:hypothetical protein
LFPFVEACRTRLSFHKNEHNQHTTTLEVFFWEQPLTLYHAVVKEAKRILNMEEYDFGKIYKTHGLALF